jgi:hypothetical protein
MIFVDLIRSLEGLFVRVFIERQQRVQAATGDVQAAGGPRRFKKEGEND